MDHLRWIPCYHMIQSRGLPSYSMSWPGRGDFECTYRILTAPLAIPPFSTGDSHPSTRSVRDSEWSVETKASPCSQNVSMTRRGGLALSEASQCWYATHRTKTTYPGRRGCAEEVTGSILTLCPIGFRESRHYRASFGVLFPNSVEVD